MTLFGSTIGLTSWTNKPINHNLTGSIFGFDFFNIDWEFNSCNIQLLPIYKIFKKW